MTAQPMGLNRRQLVLDLLYFRNRFECPQDLRVHMGFQVLGTITQQREFQAEITGKSAQHRNHLLDLISNVKQASL